MSPFWKATSRSLQCLWTPGWRIFITPQRSLQTREVENQMVCKNYCKTLFLKKKLSLYCIKNGPLERFTFGITSGSHSLVADENFAVLRLAENLEAFPQHVLGHAGWQVVDVKHLAVVLATEKPWQQSGQRTIETTELWEPKKGGWELGETLRTLCSFTCTLWSWCCSWKQMRLVQRGCLHV